MGRYVLTIFAFIFTLALLCSLHISAYSQSVSASDGELHYLHPGYTYKLLARSSDDSTITPLVDAAQWGAPVQILLSGSAGAAFQFHFHLPTGLTNCNDMLPCSFASDAIYWEQKNSLLDPNLPQTLVADSTGKITLDLGMTVTVPPNLRHCDYWAYVGCAIIDKETGDTSFITAEFWADLCGQFRNPSTDGTIDNLSRGHTYSIRPGPGVNSIFPVVNGKERVSIGKIRIEAKALDSVQVNWILPKSMVPDNEDGPPIPCRFDADAVYVEETGERADPNGPVNTIIGRYCSTTLELGMTITVPPTAARGAYTAQIIVSAVYIGNLSEKSRVISQSEAEILYVVSVGNFDIPERATLLQNYPNPFNSSTVITYGLPSPASTSLKIYDLLGREVATLVSGVQEAGWHTVEWNGDQSASGLYLCRIKSGSFTETRKLLLQR
jgi:type IX secretion system substrate protein